MFNLLIHGGTWPIDGFSSFVGLLGYVYTFFGADGAIHTIEEIMNTAVVIPKAIVFSIVLIGLLGLCIVLALLFYIGDIDAALHTKTGSAHH